MAKKSQSSRRWLKEHVNDPYVKLAQKEGYRSRAAYKLLEIQAKDHLIKPGMTVVDLGGAPGGWTQVLVKLVGVHGHVIALDCLAMEPIAGAFCLQGDFTEDTTVERLIEAIDARPIDIIVSDMLPNLSGIKGVDQPKSMYLMELALDFVEKQLRPGGHFIAKVFQGEGFDELLKQIRASFKTVSIRKPESSRSRSAELYLVAKGFRGPSP